MSVVVYRGRFDPPGQHHLATVQALLETFDQVLIVPYGPLAHRAVDENLSPFFRAHLIDLAFGRLGDRVRVDLKDIEHLVLTPHAELLTALKEEGHDTIAFAVEAASLKEDMARIPEGAAVVVVAAASDTATIAQKDTLPGRLITVDRDVEGKDMRQRVFQGHGVKDVIPEAVATIIARYGLYRSSEPRTRSRLRLESEGKIFISVDERNKRAMAQAARFESMHTHSLAEAQAIVVIGGDGSMLHAIQSHWRARLPFIGINAGHLGFLLNDARVALPEPDDAVDADAPDPAAEALLASEFVVHHMPMMHVELLSRTGTWTSGLTFNDAWMERASGQSAWLEVKVDGQLRLEKLVCDGALVSTAAGSTAYARSMGASPLLADTPAWLLVGSNVMEPRHWKSALLAKNSIVEFRSLDPDKRPVNGYLHGVPMGEVTAMKSRLSRAASVELCFLGVNDLTEKIARIQFADARPVRRTGFL